MEAPEQDRASYVEDVMLQNKAKEIREALGMCNCLSGKLHRETNTMVLAGHKKGEKEMYLILVPYGTGEPIMLPLTAELSGFLAATMLLQILGVQE